MTHSTDLTQIHQVLTRGVAQVLPDVSGLEKLMLERPIRLYLGIDPTGAFLHLGHAVALRKLQQFAELGHQVILLIGNGTVKIGDPTGRDASRPMLTDAEIEQNFIDWKSQASKVLDFSLIEIRRNGDWLDQLKMPEIIKLMAKTTVQQLIERDMFQQRIKSGRPIFGHEIMYPLLQGYDSVAMDVDLEIGGTDQTFNMMMGRQLLDAYKQKQKWVLSTPIIDGTDGRKMSKSFNNFVGLTEAAPDMYAKLMRVSDQVIATYFRVLTDLPDSQIDEMETEISQGENPIGYKKQLALAITEWLHSPEAAKAAATEFEQLVQQKQLPTEMPEIQIAASEMPLLELLKKCQPTTSSSDLRRLIDQGGIGLIAAGETVEHQQIQQNPLATIEIKSGMIVRIGKRSYFKLRN